MVNEDIAGGLRSALARGESLKQAMMSFYRAGYKKEDIEWAAKSLQIQKQPFQETKPTVAQKVSNYGQPKKPKGKLIIILLIFFLLVLLGILAGVFLFKEELVEFFDKLFF